LGARPEQTGFKGDWNDIDRHARRYVFGIFNETSDCRCFSCRPAVFSDSAALLAKNGLVGSPRIDDRAPFRAFRTPEINESATK